MGEVKNSVNLNDCQIVLKRSDGLVITCNENTIEKCQEWLEQCSLQSETESCCSTNNQESMCSSETSSELSAEIFNSEIKVSNKVVCNNEEMVQTLEQCLQQIPNTYNKVIVNKSKNVTLGNITYINGPITLANPPIQNNLEKQPHILIDTKGLDDLKIMNRRTWVAQPPRGIREYLREPAKYVIISHTATESATTIVDNILIIRLIQQFHIESRKWDDIGYNFLIGCDGNIYEGRGFNVVGAHTYHFNRTSIGISFVGCFMDILPPQNAIAKLQPLIDIGVRLGYIDENYSLIAHCQCSPVESPGRTFFAEIKKWKNWDSRIMSNNSRLFANETCNLIISEEDLRLKQNLEIP